jgi:DNA/RNA endonuclease YhcR with UshA esterase domain
MKLKNLFISLMLLPLLAFAQDHLIFTELVLQPSAGEYVVIKNPTASAVDLSDYYITDATDVANSKFYYNLPGGSNFWSGSGFDFIARFPAVSLPAGESLVLGLARDVDYFNEYGSYPDLYMTGSGADTMLHALSGQSTIGAAPSGKLDNTAETLVLFYWDGSSSTVKDVDYLLWGNRNYAVDKSAVSGYAADTPAGSQSFMPAHADGEMLTRVSDSEGTETASGGNGITGHNETSENLAATWAIAELSGGRPVLSGISLTPAAPTSNDTLLVTATVTDAAGGLTVECVYSFGGSSTVLEMLPLSGETDRYAGSIDPLGASGSLSYYVRAENSLGLKDSTIIYSRTITPYVETQTIRYLRDNYEDLQETVVTATGVVTAQMGRINTYASYIQDSSGRGIYIFGSPMSGIARGTRVSVTGTLSKYNDSMQLKDISVTNLGAAEMPAIQTFSVQALNNNYMELEGTLVNVRGQISARADGIGGGSNITLDDGTGSLTLRVWDSTNLLSDATADSLLRPGNSVEVAAIGSFYSGSAQLLPAYAEDVKAWTEGAPGSGEVTLSVAPFPFVPQLGEVINYSYAYPNNSRVILRVYDLAGRYVTTLSDEFHGMAWSLDKQWNGRDELNRLVAPGTYIMHLEVSERATGLVHRKAQPVVIAVKK